MKIGIKVVSLLIGIALVGTIAFSAITIHNLDATNAHLTEQNRNLQEKLNEAISQMESMSRTMAELQNMSYNQNASLSEMSANVSLMQAQLFQYSNLIQDQRIELGLDNSSLSILNSYLNLSQGLVWVNQNTTMSAGNAQTWNFGAQYAGYISVQIPWTTASAVNIGIGWTHQTNSGTNYTYADAQTIQTNQTAFFVVLPSSSVHITVENANTGQPLNLDYKIIYWL